MKARRSKSAGTCNPVDCVVISDRITAFFFTFSRNHHNIELDQATQVWRKYIIGQEEVLNSNKTLLGVSMDLTTTAEGVSAFGSDSAAKLPQFQSPATAEVADTSAPDLVLCRSAADGNIAAFEIIYQRYNRRTFSLCLRMTSNQTEAEDLTQEVFIQLFRKVGSFRGESAFSTWLHRLTVNQVLMHFRRRSVKNEKTSESGDMPEQTVIGTANPNKMPVIDRIALKAAIAQLPNGYRNVFVLHDIEGYEHEEVARLMKISVGTSKSQLHKARLKLRGLLIKKKE
ncbi:MAG: sigma-70 family RNA polymerase sigma factor [Pyrinomonadaceae bacterium]